MRGSDSFSESLFSVHKLDDFIPADHPLRPIRAMVNIAQGKMDALFSSMYACRHQRWTPQPQHCPREVVTRHAPASVLQRALRTPAHGVNPIQPFVSLVHWAFHGDRIWVPTVFTRNSERPIEHDTIIALFNEIPIRLASHDFILYFVGTHWFDLKTVLGGEEAI